MGWKPFDGGKTQGTTGREGGVITADEEYDGAARILVEEGCLRAPYALTASVYGYMLHTRFVADDETAQYALDEMKQALIALVDLMPGDDDSDDIEKTQVMTEAAESFMRRYA